MSLFLPFNFNPSSVVALTGSYTIPAGKYGLLSYELMISSYVSNLIASPSNNVNYDPSSTGTVIHKDSSIGSDHASNQIWLKAGDVITVVSSAPVASTSANTATTTKFSSSNSVTGFVQILVNGGIVGKASITTSVSMIGQLDTITPGISTTITYNASTNPTWNAGVSLFDIP